MNRGLILVVLLLIVCTVWGDTVVQDTTSSPPLAFLEGSQEAYVPASRDVSNAIVDEWTDRGIKISANSVTKVGMVENEQTPATRQNVVFRMLRSAPAYEAKASAVPIIVFTGGATVKAKRVHVLGRGPTKEEAVADAQRGLKDVGTHLVKHMRLEGLLVDST